MAFTKPIHTDAAMMPHGHTRMPEHDKGRVRGAPTKETNEDRHLTFTLGYYGRSKTYTRSSVRSGHCDAAHMCDAIAADIEAEHTTRGRVTKEGKALAAAVKRAGDAIWTMREKL